MRVSLADKSWNKLSTPQFQAVVRKLPEVKEQREEMVRFLEEMPEEKFDDLMGHGYNWGAIYEYSFIQHTAIAIIAFGRQDLLKTAVESPDPQQFVLDSMGQDDDPPEEPAPGWEKQFLIALVYSLQRTILSVLLYQRSLSALVREVRENNNIDALFDAVRVDRAIISCPTIAEKIAKAQLRNNKAFFLRLRNALKGPTQKHWESYCELRYSLAALRELGFDKLSDEQLYQLLVKDLKVYPDTPSARKNLRTQYQLSRKLGTI